MGFTVNESLRAAKNKFVDTETEATVTACDYYSREFGYLLRRNNKPRRVNVALHFDTDIHPGGERWLNVAAKITAAEPLFIEDGQTAALIEYDGNQIVAYRQRGYNPVADLYTYDGETPSPYNGCFIVKRETDVADDLTANSLTVWLDFFNKYKRAARPAGLGLITSQEPVILIEVAESRTHTVPQQLDDETIRFYGDDIVKLLCYNYDRKEILKLIDEVIGQEALYNLFGVTANPEINQRKEYQNGFGFVANVKELTVKINYSIETTPEAALRYIKQADYTVEAV